MGEHKRVGRSKSCWSEQECVSMDTRKKVLMVASVASMITQFNMPLIKMLRQTGYVVHVACNFRRGNTCDRKQIALLQRELVKCGVVYFQVDFCRNVVRMDENLKAYHQIKRILRKNKYEMVHCHSPVGGLIGRFASQKYRKKGLRVIYTAHGFHFYKGAPLRNWLLFYTAEWVCSWWTDVLITINKEDYRIAKRKLHAKRTEYVHGVGINVDKFMVGKADAEEKRESLNLEKEDVMLLSVGELSKRKNHEVVIRAMARLRIPQLKYFICGTGMLKEYLISLTDKLDLQKQVFLLGYRDDISELCQAADLYILPSKQEGLPVALMEAVACKTPVVCSDIRGNRDLIWDEACMFDADNAETVAECILNKLKKNSGDILNGSKLRDAISENMEYAVEQNYQHLRRYSLSNVSKEMNKIYCQKVEIV